MTANPTAIWARPPTTPLALARWRLVAVPLMLPTAVEAAQFTINGPAGSGEFGAAVTILPNGNLVVCDPGFDALGPIVDVGAVYLYRPNGTLISTLRGGSLNDQICLGGVVVLANGNFVVLSPSWDNGAAGDAGAVSFGSATSGIHGVVSPANSLIGSTTSDTIGTGVTALSNGNYVVSSPSWDRGAIVNAGAATFGDGVNGISGVISSVNSLVGSATADSVGASVVTLANGNYVVSSTLWDNGAISNAGAVTFATATTGVTGTVSSANSLVGTSTNDNVGSVTVPLTNGNYVVRSPNWDNGTTANVGAVTFASGLSGISGAVSSANSLIGGTEGDSIGSTGVAILTNGNYVVTSNLWDNGAAVNAGAATFGSGTTGITGVVSPANSLVGSSALDQIGQFGVTALSNGNYVVRSPFWDNGAIIDAGAATFGSGTSGISGLVSSTNSLIGSTTNDSVGGQVVPLGNGNYVVNSPNCDNGAIVNAGAATFGSGTSGISGIVSPVNSLVGGAANDQVGSSGTTALSNGNYVVSSPGWGNGGIARAGAVTFGSGTSGISGLVSAANSLVGTTLDARVGSSGVTPLDNGNYVVRSPLWDNGAAISAGAATFGSGVSGVSGVITASNSLVGSSTDDRVGSAGVTSIGNGRYLVRTPSWDRGGIIDAGAVTFGSGPAGVSGVVSPANSLVGSATGDQVGVPGVTNLGNGNYVVRSALWDNGAIENAGAVTLGLFDGSVVGSITSTHSVLGTVANVGASQQFGYDPLRNQLVVGQPASNRVVLQRPGIATAISIIGDAPDPSVVGQPVTFTATVTATPNAPSDGRVTFRASSGEFCVDDTATPVSATAANYSCTIAFATGGVSTVIAEYTGSILHAYSGSGPETHTTIVDPVFADGFEGP